MKSKKEKRKDKEICKDFYNRCRSYHRNLSKIEANQLKHGKIMSDIYGVSSVVVKDVIMENAGDSSHVWDHCLVEKKDELLLGRAVSLYDTMIASKMLDNIVDGEVANTITECHADRNKEHDDIAYNHNRSRPTMYSDMNRAVLSQLRK